MALRAHDAQHVMAEVDALITNEDEYAVRWSNEVCNFVFPLAAEATIPKVALTHPTYIDRRRRSRSVRLRVASIS